MTEGKKTNIVFMLVDNLGCVGLRSQILENNMQEDNEGSRNPVEVMQTRWDKFLKTFWRSGLKHKFTFVAVLFMRAIVLVLGLIMTILIPLTGLLVILFIISLIVRFVLSIIGS